MDASTRAAAELAEFIAGVSSAATEPTAARAAVEHAAEAFDAEVAAIVRDGKVVAAAGFPEGGTPVTGLEAVRPGATDAWLEVPGAGRCAAAAAMLEYPPGARLVIARPDDLTPEETGLLRAMAGFAALTMRMLGVLDRERAAREEGQRLAGEQAALRRVSTLVAQAASAEKIFSALAEEVAQLSGADLAKILRYEPDGGATVVGSWGDRGSDLAVGTRRMVTGEGPGVSVRRTGRPARTLGFTGPAGSFADAFRRNGVRAASGSPIIVEGRLWGVLIAARTQARPLSPAAEQRIPAFTELAATAIANAQARARLRAAADEQAALRRVATLVAQAAPPGEVFAALASEVGQLLPGADFAAIGRYDPDGVVEAAGAWNSAGDLQIVGRRTPPLGGRNVSTLVFETGRPARVDYLADEASPFTVAVRDVGLRSSAGAPISVEGRLWGLMIVASAHENALPAGTEHRLAGFTELAATAIANAQARQELSTSADWQAALRRVATLVARGEPPAAVFAAVAEEVARLFAAESSAVIRYDADGAVTAVGSWSTKGSAGGGRASLGGQNVTTLVFETGRPARVDRYAAEDSSDATASARSHGARSAAGAPISVEGRLWGAVEVAVSREAGLPVGIEERLAAFAELIATAIAEAQAREDLRDHVDEQAALRRVATLVAHGEPSATVFCVVAEEVAALFDADTAMVARFEPDGEATFMGGHGMPYQPGMRGKLPARSAATSVRETGRAALFETGTTMTADHSATIEMASQSAVAAPVVVSSRLWGVIGVGSRRGRLRPDTEQRLTGFAELIATAIANAEAQAELVASRVRIVVTADETRRRIERDLHDGVQQRLVSVALQLRVAQTSTPPRLGELRSELGRVVAGLTGTLDELREYARGIHPAILADGGLGAALRALARRSPVPVQLDMRTSDRLPRRIEVTVYYAVSEALNNAAKHADASAVQVAVETIAGVVRVSVSDDGAGGADPARGSGLTGLKDRVEAIGGTLTLHSPPGRGTRLVMDLPPDLTGFA